MGKAVKHKVKHGRARPSAFSRFKHRIAEAFQEIVEAPPVEVRVEEKSEPLDGVDGIIITAESVPERAEGVAIPVESEPIDEKEVEREETREKIHNYVVENLNQAVQKWKSTGEVGVHLEPPVPLRDRVKALLSKVKTKSAPISVMLKNRVEEVAEKVAARLKRAEQSGEKVNTDEVVRDEWKSVVNKIESIGGASERDEIEKIYKQLSGD